ncbi:oligopeptide ABC transporter permease OppB [Celerinatantimonas yamalensis]|uniref:Oligopeptide ABC transporter permease OppB n=1 Tax=Celerinatantimonas yamalensis TaxID=559956 RepID=A0ABW9G9D1_9GAMM
MFFYILKRVFYAIPTLLIIITLAFFMMRLAPGGPFDTERQLPPEIEANILKSYNLDKPLYEQYFIYVDHLVHFDFGPSYKYRDFSVTELIESGLPASMKIGGLAILLATLIGILLGILAALNQNKRLDYFIMSVAMTGIAIPNFVIAPVLSLILGVYLSWLPVGGWGNGDLHHIILPVFCLALPQIAYIARLCRGSMVEILHSNFVTTARAKGLRERIVVFRHALKGGLLPVITFLGPAIASITTGSVVIESIFDIPGIGRYFVNGALNRDYPLVMGVVVFYAALIIFLNLAVDIIYSFIDPKLKLGDRK